MTLGLIIAELVRREGLARQARPDQGGGAGLRTELREARGGGALVLSVRRTGLREVESLVLENNVVDWALAKVKVEDKPTDFDELMGGNK